MNEANDPHLQKFERAYQEWRAAHHAACEAEEQVVRCFDGPAEATPLSAGNIEKARQLRSRAIRMHTAAMALAPDPR